MTTLREMDTEAIRALLMGRRVIAAEMQSFKIPDRPSWSDVSSGRLTLDDGTQVYVVPNIGGCSCGAGDYDLTHLATVDNIITDVRVADESEGAEYEPDTRYRIYVIADATEINVLSVEGNDGNGYYGTGYALYVIAPDAAPQTSPPDLVAESLESTP